MYLHFSSERALISPSVEQMMIIFIGSKTTLEIGLRTILSNLNTTLRLIASKINIYPLSVPTMICPLS